jgi:hypothetical protein
MTPETSVDDRAPLHYSRVATALLATGGFALLVGGIFLLPFVLSLYPIQNDVYMGNLFLGYPLLAAGCATAFVGLMILILVPRLRHHAWGFGWRATLLAVLGALVVSAADWMIGGRYSSISGNVWWPPYLTLPIVGIALAVGVVVFFASRAWGSVPPDLRSMT